MYYLWPGSIINFLGPKKDTIKHKVNEIKTIICAPHSKVYIFCPAGFATGGPEALHQLGYQLNNCGFNAFMYYYVTPDSVGLVHKNYEKYQVPYVTRLENKPDHVIIIPETYLFPIFKRKFNLTRKVVWWLSVVNYHITQKRDVGAAKTGFFLRIKKIFQKRKEASFERLKEKKVIHIGHSFFSMVTLNKNGIEPIGQMADYMNDAFFELAKHETKKQNIIIYNPKKNDAFLQEIINLTPGLNWVPLVNMTPGQVAAQMNHAKLYVDFGYHPGKERMPREACIMRCCMIIGKVGSAAYAQDMPIPEKYRFEKSTAQIPAIIERIKYCLANYNQVINDFKPYRQLLYQEEEKFIADVKNIFIKG